MLGSNGAGLLSGGGQTPSQPVEWQFLQCFGERTPGEEVQEADVISAVEFDHDGYHLSTGDRGGRVVLFEKVPAAPRASPMDQRPPQYAQRGPGFEYRYLTEFQSHEPEFDYLKSLEIEEKINKVRWVRNQSSNKLLLSTNDKTIKLWKVYEKKVNLLTNFNLPTNNGSNFLQSIVSPRFSSFSPMGRLNQPLRMPTVSSSEVILSSRCSKVYANAHTYHINSICVNSDQETFLSADDLRINLWNLECTNQSFNIVDIKPSNMEDLTEVITAADFHPKHCNLFTYSSSKGTIRLVDMRCSALCDRNARIFEDTDSQVNKSFFSEIVASVSDVRFSRDGRYLISRDYMTLKLWDVNKGDRPVVTVNVHEHLRSRLCDLYENDCIFDKFDCCLNGRGDYVASGSYNNLFKVFGLYNHADVTLEASRDPMRKRLQTPSKANRFAIRKAMAITKRNGTDPAETGSDYTSKLLHLAWHPEANVIACAASNSLYMYCA